MPNNAISIIGLGRLGAPFAACAARVAPVFAHDINPAQIQALRDLAPPHESGLIPLLKKNSKRLTYTADVTEAVLRSSITFIVVPTPSLANGFYSNRFVVEACRAVGGALRRKRTPHVVVVTSTVAPGSMEGEIRRALEASSGRRLGARLGLCYSPQFIALGNVVNNLLRPDLVLIGESHAAAGASLEKFYRRFIERPAPIFRTSFANAEMAKLSLNAYVTMKISFANVLARACEAWPGADAGVITEIIGHDRRIGRSGLRGGVPFGGPCFPRDGAAFRRAIKASGVQDSLASAVDAINRDQVTHIARVVVKNLSGRRRVAILGAAYKAGTPVVVESPSLALGKHLQKRGISVIFFDPLISPPAAPKGLRFTRTLEDALGQASAAVIMTPCEDFLSIDAHRLKSFPGLKALIDGWGLLGGLRGWTGRYVQLGRFAASSSFRSARPN